MKRLLIISPYFPPSNAADMQRVRMSLPYFKRFGWLPEVVTVDPIYSDMTKDELLLESVPEDLPIHYVKAFSKKWTSKIGLGSIALRSLYFYKQKVNQLLKANHFDLIYFSTTQFPVTILGAYWKKKFGIPFVIDMQDPWHSDYYLDKPKAQRPPKYWFSYRLNKYLEPIAMKEVSGIISVSDSYVDTLRNRYPHLHQIPVSTITFGAFEKDAEIARTYKNIIQVPFKPVVGRIQIVYVGRGGHDMSKSLSALFRALNICKKKNESLFTKLHFHFIGTSYAPQGKGIPTVIPIAQTFGVANQVTEITDRIGFYSSINALENADAVFAPGSDDPAYTASKIFPYLLSNKPALYIFHAESSVVDIVNNCTPAANLFTFSDDSEVNPEKIVAVLERWANRQFDHENLNRLNFQQYMAENMVKKQVALFNLLAS